MGQNSAWCGHAGAPFFQDFSYYLRNAPGPKLVNRTELQALTAFQNEISERIELLTLGFCEKLPKSTGSSVDEDSSAVRTPRSVAEAKCVPGTIERGSRSCREPASFSAMTRRLSIARAAVRPAIDRAMLGDSRRQRRPPNHGTEPTFLTPRRMTLLAKMKQMAKRAANALAS